MVVIQLLKADRRVPQSISLIEGGTLGLDLLYPLDGITHLLAIDAIDAGVAPGTLDSRETRSPICPSRRVCICWDSPT
jgi:hydrogenase maturation protease